MANWKFTDDYLSSYPALENSILSLLVFSEHAIEGSNFTGTMDVNSTGVALGTLGQLVGLQSIAVSGTIVEDNNTLTVTFQSNETQSFLDGIKANIPLIGNAVTQASASVRTVTDKSQTAEDDPFKDEFILNVTLTIGSASVDIISTVPMNGGFFTLIGEFTGVGIQLSDLNFLMGSLAGGEAWFPSQQLGPYNEGSPSYGLLSLSVTGYIVFSPAFSIAISSVTVMVGISQLPIYETKMYLDPLGVWVTVSDPIHNAQVAWGLSGEVKLLNYNNQGVTGLDNPDFTFNFDMGFPYPPSQPNFSFSGYLDNPDGKPVNLMLQDLLGPGTNVGLSSELVIESFELDSIANITTGEISDFSTSIEISGGFGILSTFDLEKISIGVTYSGD